MDELNLECYHSLTPPQVHVENINVTDLFLIYSDDDLLSDDEDVERLKETLRSECISDSGIQRLLISD